jgi:hypothetical protein
MVHAGLRSWNPLLLLQVRGAHESSAILRTRSILAETLKVLEHTH